MAAKIKRPGAAADTRRAETDSAEIPLKLMRDALISGYLSWAEVETLAVTTGVLGGWETVALFGAAMGTAGAGVVFVLAAAALLKYYSRTELPEAATTIGVMTSPGGLPVMAAMQAGGYSVKEAVRVGEYAKAAFSAAKMQHDAAKEYENWKEEASALNDMRELRDFMHERASEIHEGASEKEKANAQREADLQAFKELLREMRDTSPEEAWRNFFTITRNTRDVAPAAVREDGSDSNGSDMGKPPGLGEIGDHRPGHEPGDNEHDGGEGEGEDGGGEGHDGGD